MFKLYYQKIVDKINYYTRKEFYQKFDNCKMKDRIKKLNKKNPLKQLVNEYLYFNMWI